MIDIFYYKDKLIRTDFKDLEKVKDEDLWVDATNISKEETAIISKIFKLHPTTEEDLFKSNVRIKVEEFDDYLFCIYYGVKHTKNFEMQEIDFVIGKNFVISNHKKQIDSFEELKNNKERLETIFKKTPDFIFHEIIDKEIDNFFPMLEDIDSQIESIEMHISKKPKQKDLTDILKLKKLIIMIRKRAFEQREKISFLNKREYKFISKEALPYFRDVYDNAIRVSDSIENSREMIGNAYDIYMSTMSNNMNKVMKVLSVIATLVLPLTVISGIYGTNFSNLPGQNFHYGFWVMIGGMFLLSGFSLVIFKKKGWF